MPGFILFVIGLVGSFIVFEAPGIDIWYGPGFWAAAVFLIVTVIGFGLLVTPFLQLK